jgi:hypothetical protein
MNFHKNNEDSCTTKVFKGEFMSKANWGAEWGNLAGIGSALGAFGKWCRHMLGWAETVNENYYKRFGGKSKTFKKNKRKGL